MPVRVARGQIGVGVVRERLFGRDRGRGEGIQACRSEQGHEGGGRGVRAQQVGESLGGGRFDTGAGDAGDEVCEQGYGRKANTRFRKSTLSDQPRDT